jgi:hypothetical protein
VQRVGQAPVAGVAGQDDLLCSGRSGDRGLAGVVLAGFRVGVAVGVVAELGEHPGAEDHTEAGLAGTAHGIGNALRDAERLADAIATGLDGGRLLNASLADHQRRRDAAIGPMYDFSTDLAAFNPPRPADQQLLSALRGRQAEIDPTSWRVRRHDADTGVPLPA